MNSLCKFLVVSIVSANSALVATQSAFADPTIITNGFSPLLYGGSAFIAQPLVACPTPLASPIVDEVLTAPAVYPDFNPIGFFGPYDYRRPAIPAAMTGRSILPWF